MTKKELMAAAIPVLELVYMVIGSIMEKLDKLSSYDGTEEEYLASRKRMIRFFRFKRMWE